MTDDARRFLDDQAVIRQTASLRLMVRALLRDDASVDDVVQETWLTAMEHPPREGFDAGGWLRGIARNAIRHLRRSDVRRERRESHAAARVEPAAGQVVAKIEQLQELLEAVSALRDPIRQTVALRYLDGLMPREIADRLSIPVATVKTRLSTGLRQLREALDARHGGDRSAWRALLAPLVPDLARAAVAAASAGATSAGTFAVGGLFMKAASLVAGFVAVVSIVVAVLWPSDPEHAAPIETTAGAAPSVSAPVDGTIDAPRRLVPKTVVEAALPAADESPSGGSARARGPFERVTLKGRCVAADSGAPLARCRVTLTGHQATGYDLAFEHLDWRNPDPVTTAEDGAFKFTLGLPQFESTSAGYAPRVHVSIAHPDRVAAFGSVNFGEFPRGKTMDLGDVSLAAGAKQQIRVADVEGQPVPGAAVRFTRVMDERIDPFSRPRIASQDADVARTRLDGSLAFDGRLKPGRWTASLYREQQEAQVEFVVPPSAELAPPATIVLPSGAPTSRISGRVVDRDLRPVAGLSIGAFDKKRIGSADPTSSMTRTAEDGTFVIRATSEARDATPNVMFTRNSRYDAWSSFGEYAWGESNLQLVFEADATLALFVVDEGGAPVTDFAVRCVPAKGVRSPGPLRLTAHDASGKLEMRGVAPGTHRLFVFPLASELAPSEWEEIQVPSSGSVEVRVTLERAVERKVRVVRAGGGPVAGTKVELVFGGDAAPAPERRIPAIGVEYPHDLPVTALRVDEGFTDAAGEVALRGPRSAENVWIRALGPGHVPTTLGLTGWSEDQVPIEIGVAAAALIRGTVGPAEVLDGWDATLRSETTSLSLHHGTRPHAYARARSEGERQGRPRILALTPVEAAEGFGPGRVLPLEREAAIAADGTFEISDLAPGVYHLRLVTFTSRPREFLRREVHPEPLAVVTTTPENPAEVSLSIAGRLALPLRGRVTLDGAPLALAEVDLFAVPGAPGLSTDVLATLRTDRAGAFVARSLPAGEYVAVVIVPAGPDRASTRIPSEARVRIDPERTAPIEIDARWSTVRFREVDGKPDGPWITWHANGRKHSEGSYEKGQREGAWKFWTLAGAPDARLSGTYAAGVRTGP